jgi:Flp pilus assembly protein TadG
MARRPDNCFSKKERGLAAVEFAILLPLLLAILFGITEFGRAIYTYNTLAKSARAAARYLSTQPAGSNWAIARNIAVFGAPNPAASASPIATGFTTSQVRICDSSNVGSASWCNSASAGTNPTINTVTVTIHGYQFTPVVDILAFTRLYSGGNQTLNILSFDDIAVTMRRLP